MRRVEVVLASAHRVTAATGDLVGATWDYRILHRVRDDVCEVVVLRIEHRRDVYRPQ
ncbi:MAG: hypothetical protein LH469_00480 [Frankiaceae bacterium]|nr:hypothetical protein [Frankiaceae bacterium]